MSEDKKTNLSKEEQDRVRQVREKGEALAQFEEFMQRYQGEEVSKIEESVINTLLRSMIAELFLEHAYTKEDPATFIDEFFEKFEEVNKSFMETKFVDVIPDSSQVENMIFASMFPSREKVQKEIDVSFHRAKEWYSKNIIRNYVREKAQKDGNKGKDK